MKHLLLLLLTAGLLTGCEKNVDFPLQQSEPKLVVEATIENGQPPLVFITRSLNYFSNFSPELLEGSFVHGAIVEISNGTATYRLREYTVPADTTNYFVSFYTIDSANLPNALFGQLQTNYSLRIIADGEEYTAQTRIPAITKRIDSLWWRPNPRDSSEGKVQVMGKVTDPPGYGDYGRYWTRRNGADIFLPGRNSVFDDLVVDGTTYTIPIDPGVDRNSSDGFDERVFRLGDTVTVKLANIDRNTFDFWRTWEYSRQSIGNPFSTPTRVLGNISNGALGYFGGYAAQTRTIIIR
ncbi:MAG: DUF4249 domain-containing protein [Chitinophagaceae bacterium]|nr:MAG: DUF4249 domain-containing protein [Chitinophagaceae bacterium]